MKSRPLVLFFLFLAAFTFHEILFCPVWGEEQSVDGFQESSVGDFPSSWKTYPFQGGKAKRVYKIEQEGSSKFLRAVDDEQLSVTILRRFSWDIKKYPYLKFRWRAQTLPQVATGGPRPVNDHACGVYVVFGWTSGLKYVWSSSMPKGESWAKVPGKFVIISKEFGPGQIGNWNSVTANVPEDTQKYLGKPLLKDPTGIALLTDGDNSHQKAACDYADFKISDKP
jgi:hypothetical protein